MYVCMCVCVSSVMSDSLWNHEKEFSRQEYWSGLPFPTPRDLPNPGTEPASLVSPALQADSLPLCYLGSLSPQLNLPHLTCRMEVSCKEMQVKETKGCHSTQFPDWKTGMSLREAVNWIMVPRYCLGKAGDKNKVSKVLPITLFRTGNEEV